MDAKDIALIKALGGGGSGGSITVDSELSDTSENPVQNKVVKVALDGKLEKRGIADKTENMTQSVGVDDDGALWTVPVSGGVPDGGTEGQLLGKTEDGAAWVDPPQSGVQSDWNENDSSSPAYILNKPENLGGGVTWFVASGDTTALEVRTGENWEDGDSVTGSEIINAFENGICRFKITVVNSCGTYEGMNGTMIGYRTSGAQMRAYIYGSHYMGFNYAAPSGYGTKPIDM